MEVAEHEGAVFAAEVHAVTLAEREGLAGFAGFLLAHPGAVAIGLEAVFPDLPSSQIEFPRYSIIAMSPQRRRNLVPAIAKQLFCCLCLRSLQLLFSFFA